MAQEQWKPPTEPIWTPPTAPIAEAPNRTDLILANPLQPPNIEPVKASAPVTPQTRSLLGEHPIRRFFFGPSKEDLGGIEPPRGPADYSLLPKWDTPSDDNIIEMLRGAYNFAVRPLGSAEGFMGAGQPGKTVGNVLPAEANTAKRLTSGIQPPPKAQLLLPEATSRNFIGGPQGVSAETNMPGHMVHPSVASEIETANMRRIPEPTTYSGENLSDTSRFSLEEIPEGTQFGKDIRKLQGQARTEQEIKGMMRKEIVKELSGLNKWKDSVLNKMTLDQLKELARGEGIDVAQAGRTGVARQANMIIEEPGVPSAVKSDIAPSARRLGYVEPTGQQPNPEMFNANTVVPGKSRFSKGDVPLSAQGKTPAGTPPTTPPPTGPEQSRFWDWYDFSRGAMPTDLPFISSAAWRQGNGYLGTKAWWQAWGKAKQAYGSEAAAKLMEAERMNSKWFKPNDITLPDGTVKKVASYAEQAGLRRGAFDERLRTNIAERIPYYGKHISASNRAFTAFIDHLGDTNFEAIMESAERMGLKPTENLEMMKEVAGMINTTLKRTNLGSAEQHIKWLSRAMFSPRATASEVKMIGNMLNPNVYMNANKPAQKLFLQVMGRRLGLWTAIAGAAYLGGAEVSLDMNSADFGKIKIGKNRIDPPAGLQQFLVLARRMGPGGGITDETGKFTPINETYGGRIGQLGRFAANRLHPTARYGYDLLGATKSDPIGVLDRTAQLATPMWADSIKEIMEDDPWMVPVMTAINNIGAGTQSYEPGDKFNAPKFIPSEYDYQLGK